MNQGIYARLCVAIHERRTAFSDRWIEYCRQNGIRYKLVDCWRSDVIPELSECHILLWLWSHAIPQDVRVARDVIRSAELMGLRTFPNTSTCWSFDNKLSQKYQLEAIHAPLVPTHVFLEESAALEWLAQTSFPKVFKLSRGAGSRNVILVTTPQQGAALVRRAFRRGFRPLASTARDTLQRLKGGATIKSVDLFGKIARMPATLRSLSRTNRHLGLEIGYAIFQDFIPGNQFDTRITIVGGRAFGFTRNVRVGDFRASGSGSLDYSLERIRSDCVTIAFQVSRALRLQSVALDFLTGTDGRVYISEISYAYIPRAVYDCPGHWDESLNWHPGHIWPQDAVLEDLFAESATGGPGNKPFTHL